ncbi:glutamine synthetase family protein [Micromonospora endophytica]|uniref:Glutamine synthetase n=1 Tax=Micromonospora endophytica TaxID=515350 RepID=A0A2W2D5P9_9ACTN|nr:glutamine synthetase family protein [Micromonospora endophytica]PZF99018.1 glutamine synthetase [Micromonospora endophytica]RIW51388.1 glutamine synthetase [Micromonospora endophytica]
MRNADERDVASGGGGASARPMLAKDRGGFIDRHDLWTEAQYAAAAQMRRVIDELGIEMVRFGFVDQHGIVRGKTIARSAVAAAMRSGLTAPSSLLLKDTSGKSVYPVFAADTGVGVAGFAGAGDIVLVPDPSSFRVVPWAQRTGWVLCDVRFPDGSAVPFCTRGLLRDQLGALAGRGYGMTVGAELEFHVFRAAEATLTGDRVGRPGAPGAPAPVGPTTPGAQLLHEEALDGLDPLVQALYTGLTSLDLPLRSIELEFGPSQLELTMEAADAATTADAVVVCRTAVRQIARRHGFHATFMSRPQGAETASTGWHLHQSLTDLRTGRSVFVPDTADAGPLSATGRAYLEGLLRHAAAAAAFTTPTVNGYKRYQSHSLAPDRVAWGVDNKGAMVRAVGGPGDPATRLENRSGEPAANPYLYIAAQALSGLDGITHDLELRPPTTNPYAAAAPPLPRSLGEAVAALEADEVFRAALGDVVVDWYAHLKRTEYERYLLHVSDWEQREYFGLF